MPFVIRKATTGEYVRKASTGHNLVDTMEHATTYKTAGMARQTLRHCRWHFSDSEAEIVETIVAERGVVELWKVSEVGYKVKIEQVERVPGSFRRAD